MSKRFPSTLCADGNAFSTLCSDDNDPPTDTTRKRQKGSSLVTNNDISSDFQSITPTSESVPRTRLPKRTYALVFGYIGSGFCGLQKQLNSAGEEVVRTVEGELEKAIIKCGAISPENAGNQHKVHWSRVARTDKGVHAAAQVIALKMQLPSIPSDHPTVPEKNNCANDPQVAVSSSNTLLSSELVNQRAQEAHFVQLLQSQLNMNGLGNTVRVFNLYRVTKSFDARLQCSSRAYKYVLPLSALRPPTITEVGKQHPGYRYYMTLKPSERPTIDADSGDDDKSSSKNVVKERSTEEAAAASADRIGALSAYSSTGATSESVSPPNDSATVVQSSVTVAHDAVIDGENKNDTLPTYTRQEIVELQKRVKALMEQYKGSPSFHNFTPGGRAGDPSMCRFMEELDVESMELENEPVLVIKLKGQSFLLNQIRKMIGLVIEIIRGTAPEDAIPQCLNKQNKRHIHLAPGPGLFLERVFYDMYNSRRANPPTTPTLDFDDIAEDIASFQQTVLYPAISHEYRTNRHITWDRWNADTAKYPFFVTNYPPKQVTPLSARQRFTIKSSAPTAASCSLEAVV